MEKEVTEIVDPKAPETSDTQKIWMDYLQKCCELGQLIHNLSLLESQQRIIEKNIEVTQREVKSLDSKHKQLKANQTPTLMNPPTTDDTGVEAKAH